MYLLVYVDDMILTGNNPPLTQKFISQINFEFAVKDLGNLTYFLDLEVSYTNNGLFLTQAKYAYDILLKTVFLKPNQPPPSYQHQILCSPLAFHDLIRPCIAP